MSFLNTERIIKRRKVVKIKQKEMLEKLNESIKLGKKQNKVGYYCPRCRRWHLWESNIGKFHSVYVEEEVTK